MAAKQFKRRWYAFMRWLRKSKEFQNRGSPHLHILLWIKDAPNLDTLDGRKSFPDFIDRYVSSTLPRDAKLRELVLKYQIHKHTFTCKKKDHSKCRFDFPRKPCDRTRLLPYTSVNCKRFYETLRGADEQYINPYNCLILSIWEANHDIQFIGNAFGAAAYICAYLSKCEPKELTDIVKRVVAELKQNSTSSDRQKLTKFGSTILGKRVLSASEAAFRLLSLPLYRSSRRTIFVNCRPASERYKILLPELSCRDAVELIQTADFEELSDYCQTDLIDSYSMRPKTVEFEEMSLCSFATWFTIVPENPKIPKERCLQDGRGLLKRQKQACIRTNRVSLEDTENYYLRLLMLHQPFRVESDLKNKYDSFYESFCNCHAHLSATAIDQMSFADELEKCIQDLNISTSLNSRDLVDKIISNTIKQNGDYAIDNPPETENWQSILQGDPESIDLQEIDPSSVMADAFKMETNHVEIQALNSFTMTDLQFQKKIISMNEEQRNIFDMVLQHINKKDPDPMRLFVSGNAGVGKSYLIDLLNELILRSYNTEAGPVLKTAFTGVASFNIKGSTLHRAFLLPVDHNYKVAYSCLGGPLLDEMRKFLIIDEISMVSYRYLEFVLRRLSDVNNTNNPFGNINVITFGDFYQLKPVKAPFLFQGQTANLMHLFNDLFLMKTLQINMRQSSDKMYAELLNRIRIGAPTANDIEILISRIGGHETDSRFDDSLRVFSTNVAVDDYNDTKLKALADSSGERLILVTAKHTILNRNPGTKLNMSKLIPVKDTQATGLPRVLKIITNARVMLIRNLDVQRGLVNGALGTIIHINTNELATVTSITVRFDIGNQIEDITKMNVKFFGNCDSVIERSQFECF